MSQNLRYLKVRLNGKKNHFHVKKSTIFPLIAKNITSFLKTIRYKTLFTKKYINKHIIHILFYLFFILLKLFYYNDNIYQPLYFYYVIKLININFLNKKRSQSSLFFCLMVRLEYVALDQDKYHPHF
jgi:hypothetical protein